MDIEKIIKLHEAGFAAADIEKMMAAFEPKAPEAPESPVEAPKKAEGDNNPKPEEKPVEKAASAPEGEASPLDDTIKTLNARIDAVGAALEKIAKMPLFPSIDDVKPLGIDDVISNFFKE